MTEKLVLVSVCGLRRVAGLLAIGLFLVVGVAEGNPGRARMSRDLADHLAANTLQAARVIVAGDQAQVEAIALRHGGRVARQLERGAVIEIPGGRLRGLSEDPDVAHLSGDAVVRRLMNVTADAIGADQAWGGTLTGQRYTGRGVGVAVIDSGIANHKAIRQRIVASFDFTTARAAGGDPYGHGTHVGGIIAGGGDSGYAGIAPGAHLVSLRVLDATGTGYTSDVIAAIDWAVRHRAQYGLRIVNLSLGHPVFESYRDDPLTQAVERAVKAGLVVVASAGNFGKTQDGRPIVGGIVSPGNSPFALTVGATNTRGTVERSDDVMATYSSRGPTAVDGLLKPDLVAPGNRVAAAAAVASYLTRTYADRVVLGQGQQSYLELSGTSMAAAVVSGAAALLLEARPGLTPEEVKAALQVTSSAVAGAGLVEAGAGQVNVAAALALVTGAAQDNLPVTFIGSETALSNGILYGTVRIDRFAQGVPSKLFTWGSLLVWGNHTEGGGRPASLDAYVDGHILVWGNYIQLVGSHTPANLDLTWGNILVWGNLLLTGDDHVSGNILVWGNQAIDGYILVWGDILVWGNHTAHGNILVWGNQTVDGNILVWGNQTVEGNILVWGNQTPEANILVWGNGIVDGNILVWGNHFADTDWIFPDPFAALD